MITDTTKTLRRPRCRLVVSGSQISGCHTVEISTSNLAQAGSFFIQVANNTAAYTSLSPWFGAETLDVSIQMGFLPSSQPEGALAWQEMMAGRVDHMRLDPVGGTLTLDGRDHAARLIDLAVTENFLNNTSSEVAQQLAGRCDLSAVVDGTSTLIGQYYQIEHARIALKRFSRFATAWDLLTSLAQLEGFDIWVEGTNLHFQAATLRGSIVHRIDLGAASPNLGSPSLNVSSLLVERSLVLGKGLPVAVTSWNSRQRMRVSATAGAVSGSTQTSISVVRPNLLQDTAQILADGVFAETFGHQRTLTATMAGDLDMRPRDAVEVSGVGAGWDGLYSIDAIEREMTLVGGFLQRITAKTMTA